MEKPDFEQIASFRSDISDHSMFLGFKAGCEQVWDTHVVPLQKTLKEIDAFIDTCNDEYKREYADLELKVRRQSDHIEVLKTEIKALREEIERLKAEQKGTVPRMFRCSSTGCTWPNCDCGKL